MAPPIVPPNWFRFSVSRFGAKKSRALKTPFLRNSNASPWRLFVPDFVTTFTLADACTPYCAGRVLDSTLNSCKASGNGNGRFRLLYASLCATPSKLYAVQFEIPPATEIMIVG